MSERTTIGGTVYETVGSSSSNLLLKCNGTARIQWGNKLIDLIKNGKIASEGGSMQISIISDESEIKSDGLYIIKKDESYKFVICIKGEHYTLTGSDLYISATTKQDITDEQQKQALQNLGIYFNTLQDVQNSGITSGLVYVLENNTLYNIKDRMVEIFLPQPTALAVEEINKIGEVINTPTSSNEGFTRGMIVMHSDSIEIPIGWALCDGQDHVYNGETVPTPYIQSTYNSVIFIMKL